MSRINSEEKSPLLYVVNDDLPLKNEYFETGRFNGIATGATSVFTHFPSYIGTCWIATAVSALLFFIMILLVLSTITFTSFVVPRCTAGDNSHNRTIHLVSTYVQHSPVFEQIAFIQEIITLYPTYNIRIIEINENKESHTGITEKLLFEKTTESKSTMTSISSIPDNKGNKRQKRRREAEDAERMLWNLFLHAKLIEKIDSTTVSSAPTVPVITKKIVSTIEELVHMYPNIEYERITYAQAFFDSPLRPTYQFINNKLKLFAVRILQIWQYGGISFDLHTPTKNVRNLISNGLGKNNFVISERDGNTWSDVVIVDDKAQYLESKVPCHTFYGQILMILKKANEYMGVTDVMKKGIRGFCVHYLVGTENCKMYLK